MSCQKILKNLVLLFLFLVPWQTRWIYDPGILNGGIWEYGTLSLYGTEILMWTIIFLFCVCWFFKRKFWPKELAIKSKWWRYGRLGIGGAVILFFIFLIYRSSNFEVPYQLVLRLLGGFCLFNILLKLGDRKRQIASLWAGGVLQGALALWQFFSQQVMANKWLGLAAHNAKELGASVIEFGDERWLRAYGSFGWPNALGIYLAIILVFGVWLYLNTEDLRIKLVIMFGQLAVLTGLILSFSRGAWLAAVGGLIAFFIFQKKGRLLIAKNVLYYGLVCLLFFLILKPLFLTRIDSNERLEIKSLTERKSQIAEWKNIFAKNYWLGVGPGLYTQKIYKENPDQPVWKYQPVHNIYLLILVEWGIIGSIIWFSLFSWLIYYIFKKNKFFLSVLTVLLVAGLFDHWLWTMYSGIMIWWTVFGLTVPEEK